MGGSKTMGRTIFVLCLITILLGLSTSEEIQELGSLQLETSSGIAFTFVHRDAPRSPFKPAADIATGNPLQDVIRHIQALQARINRHRSKKAAFGPVVTMGQAALEYYMPLQLGTPPTEVLLIMDTGSDVTWLQCVPCNDCVPAFRRPFNPRHSSSFVKLPCSSTTCKSLYQATGHPLCSPSGRTCLFSTGYADGSLSSGLLATETIRVNTTASRKPAAVTNITFGCANVDREGVATGASGLLGMDRRPISFTSQMAQRFGSKFSYCFPDKISHLNSSGVVFFGESGVLPQQLKYTQLLKNVYIPSASLDYYYVGLTGLSVNNSRLPLPEDAFSIKSTDGSGGTIIDSGTAFTYLLKPAFKVLKREFLAKTTHLNQVKDPIGLSPCYNITNGALDSTNIPNITLHFQGGVDVVLRKHSILVPVRGDDAHTTFCFAFQTGDTIPFNIIANYQQQNLWIEYNLEKLQLGLAHRNCAAD